MPDARFLETQEVVTGEFLFSSRRFCWVRESVIDDFIQIQYTCLYMSWTQVHHLHNRAKASLDEIPDGLVAVFVDDVDSQLFGTQRSFYEDAQADLERLPLTVLFVSGASGESDHEQFLVDPQREIINLDPALAKRDSLESHLFILRKTGDTLTPVYSRKQPEPSLNWIEYFVCFTRNYKETKPDVDNLWRIAQVVPKDGEYLCVDCGYIEEFKTGELFPLCEVCLSGDPDGPSAVAKGYWEYLG